MGVSSLPCSALPISLQVSTSSEQLVWDVLQLANRPRGLGAASGFWLEWLTEATFSQDQCLHFLLTECFPVASICHTASGALHWLGLPSCPGVGERKLRREGRKGGGYE